MLVYHYLPLSSSVFFFFRNCSITASMMGNIIAARKKQHVYKQNGNYLVANIYNNVVSTSGATSSVPAAVLLIHIDINQLGKMNPSINLDNRNGRNVKI